MFMHSHLNHAICLHLENIRLILKNIGQRQVNVVKSKLHLIARVP